MPEQFLGEILLKKLIFTLAFGFSSLFAGEFKEYIAQILSIDKDVATIKDSKDIVLGSRGVVLHKFGSDEGIMASAVVSQKQDGIARLSLSPFKNLHQDAFPDMKPVIQVGDSAVLNYLYDRGFIIAPNKQSYDEIVLKFAKSSFLPVDVAASVFDTDEFATKKGISKICADNALGLVYLGLDKKGYILDCFSFKPLKSFSLSSDDAQSLSPFYSHIGNANKAYTKYYTKLFDLKEQD